MVLLTAAMSAATPELTVGIMNIVGQNRLRRSSRSDLSIGLDFMGNGRNVESHGLSLRAALTLALILLSRHVARSSNIGSGVVILPLLMNRWHTACTGRCGTRNTAGRSADAAIPLPAVDDVASGNVKCARGP